jgi:glycerol kinase
LDQGTSSSRAILFDQQARPVAVGRRPVPAIYPRPGWVEQDAEVIWRSQWQAVEDCLRLAGVGAEAIAAIGIANQRETTVVWEWATGRPVAPAIVWQCRRTADRCEALKEQGLEPLFRERTGLLLDPYFSGTKAAWILDEQEHLATRARSGEVVFGTVDSWLVFQLTGGRAHVTDPSNASRTLLFDIHQLRWDAELASLLGVPLAMLPTVVDTSGVVGETDPRWFGRPIPVAALVGDQQAALFGQACLAPGRAKTTYGTGSFLLTPVGAHPVLSTHGLLTTVAWRRGGQTTYALEGAVFTSGAVVQWLRDELGIIRDVDETETLARSVGDTGGVYLVPAFAGLGAPYWDSRARGILVGLTRGTGRAHVVRAALEAVAYQTRDVLEVMQQDAAVSIKTLRVDGGAIRNNFLAQFQADILGVPVERPAVIETTALGAALLAGLAVGFWPDLDTVEGLWRREAVFLPHMDPDDRRRRYAGWIRAVDRAREWDTGADARVAPT